MSERTTAMPDPNPSEMLPEYEFTTMSGVVRGKYPGRVTSTPRMVRLADDLVDAFADDEAVNEALRNALARSVAAADR